MNNEYEKNRSEIQRVPEVEKTDRYALLSVSNKTGIVDFAKVLTDLGYRIISTGGTAGTLTESEIPVIPIQDITGNPEAFEGRMKTISFPIEGGVLFDRTKPDHVAQAQQLGIPQIDIVVCSLYPFEATIAKQNVTIKEAVENIDVGGPTMVRAAAKNHENVLVIVDPADYPRIAEALQKDKVTYELRKELAAKAFRHLAFYDAQIARYLGSEQFPQELTIPVRAEKELRYGDNPGQKGVMYLFPWATESPMAHLKRLTGRESSATNITDIDAGLRVVRLFREPAAVVIKHNTPCGIALGETHAEALMRTLEADPESAFGGVVVLNGPMTREAAQAIDSFKQSGRGQMDVVAATGIDDETLEFLKSIRKSTGIYTFGKLPPRREGKILYKAIDGGFILQTENNPEASYPNWKVVTNTKPSEQQLTQMRFAWKCLSRIKSNTVIVVDPLIPMTRGIGTGQTSRVLATEIALARAGQFTKGGILASDSFFPFPDSVQLAGEKGIASIIQQGGSINDRASIEAANELGITMVLTGQRLFWH